MTAHPLASFDPQDVGAVLLADFRTVAGSQALFRAFLAERDHDATAVLKGSRPPCSPDRTT